jgi:hypothetical protein
MFIGIRNTLAKLLPFSNQRKSTNIETNYIDYLEHGYPSNHTYRIKNNKLHPKYKLASRYKKIQKLLPANISSLAEIGCSKGFFIFEASSKPNFIRGLGIDIAPYNIEVCNWVKSLLGSNTTQFENVQLHEVAENIDAFHGPFQTVLILNTYQYLYFGSDPYPECYLDHDAIFRYLRKICSGRIIFNNRVDLADCQNVKCVEKSPLLSKANYSEKKALEAASKYFTIKRHGRIGKYPLFTFDVISD